MGCNNRDEGCKTVSSGVDGVYTEVTRVHVVTDTTGREVSSVHYLKSSQVHPDRGDCVSHLLSTNTPLKADLKFPISTDA